jgi:hypothetical protein
MHETLNFILRKWTKEGEYCVMKLQLVRLQVMWLSIDLTVINTYANISTASFVQYNVNWYNGHDRRERIWEKAAIFVVICHLEK